MTIDLGFAWTTLPSGERVAFVDVPGHERFVTNMLAGAGPAPAVMFVVAADEGWMPQSAEHLAAIDALGVRHGMLVVTRADLADPAPALRQAAQQDRRHQPRASVEAVAVSAVTGQGLPGLVAALGRLAARLPGPTRAAASGCGWTGCSRSRAAGPWSPGRCRPGPCAPGTSWCSPRPCARCGSGACSRSARRAGQVSGVARVALNLRGVSTRELGRGMALIQPGRWTVTSVIDVRLAPPRRRTAQLAATCGCRRSSRCTSARRAPWPGSGCWAASSPG